MSGPDDTQRPVVETRAVGEEQHQRPVGEPVDEQAHPLNRGSVCPVEILDYQEQWSLIEAPFQHDPHQHQDLATEAVGLDVGGALGRLQPENVAHHRRHTCGLFGVDAQLAETLFDLPSRDLHRIRRHESVALANEHGNDAIGLLAERRAHRAAYGHGLSVLSRLDAFEKFLHQARLAGTRFPDQTYDLGTPAQREIESRQHLLHFVVAPHQRGLEPMGLEPAGGPRLVLDADEPVDGQRLSLAFQCHRSAWLEDEGVMGKKIGSPTHQRFTGFRRGLQSRGRVHRVAGHGVRSPCGTDVAGNDATRVDAHMQRQRTTKSALPPSAESGDAGMHLERRPQRTLRIFFMSDRRTEHSHRSVADKLLHEAAEARQRRAQLLVELALERTNVFGIEPLAERGEAGEIGKQHGDGTAVGVLRVGDLIGRRRRRLGCNYSHPEIPAATRTEGEVRRGRSAARRTCGGELRPAFRAKRKVLRSFEPTTCTAHDVSRTSPVSAGR